jgi:hypothetical protein
MQRIEKADVAVAAQAENIRDFFTDQVFGDNGRAVVFGVDVRCGHGCRWSEGLKVISHGRTQTGTFFHCRSRAGGNP